VGLRITDSQQPHYPPIDVFTTAPPFYVQEDDAWLQFLPRYSYEVDVEYHPRARLAPAPPEVQPWRIGIVQNVLYERILIEYLDQEPYTTTWTRPALDLGSEAYRPFYNEPYTVEVRIPISVAGVDRLVEDRVQIVAVHELFYGPRGLGQLLDPWDPDGYHPMPNQVVRLRMEDQPVLPIRNWYGSELVRAEQVLVVRFWVIAMEVRSRSVVLGLSPPFTLVAWMRLAPRQLRSIQPRPSWGSYSLSGVHTRIIESSERVERLQSRSERLRPVPGSTPAPLLTGTAANTRTSKWMRGNGLSPAPREAERP
jgi:hypothetical protein